jgi:outer membrane receptor for monomeric catechols
LRTRQLVKTLACDKVLWRVRYEPQQVSITGTVVDPKRVLSGVFITLRAPAGLKSQAPTESQGKYCVDNFVSRLYELSFVREGFETVGRTLPIPGESSNLDVTLAGGRISTSVDVTDVAGEMTGSSTAVSDRDISSQIGVVRQRTLQERGLNDLAAAVENVSGVSVHVRYGVYERCMIDEYAQQSGNDFLHIDGMAPTGNRPQTQLDHIEEVLVLKGRNAVLLGGAGASQGGMGNVIRKQAQATRTGDQPYRAGVT